MCSHARPCVYRSGMATRVKSAALASMAPSRSTGLGSPRGRTAQPTLDVPSDADDSRVRGRTAARDACHAAAVEGQKHDIQTQPASPVHGAPPASAGWLILSLHSQPPACPLCQAPHLAPRHAVCFSRSADRRRMLLSCHSLRHKASAHSLKAHYVHPVLACAAGYTCALHAACVYGTGSTVQRSAHCA